MDESTPLLQDQPQHLSHKRLLVIFPALALIHFISFLDQTAISTSLPAIASSLDIGASISWVGASFLVTSTSIQLINGRLSDIFGRKASLVAAISIMGIANLLSGFSTTPIELFASRALAGFGAGAINALVQIAIADITTLEQRGYYFGIMGIAVALGNGLGPVIGGLLTQAVGWRWAFWFVCPLCVVAISYLVSVWPVSRPVSGEYQMWDKLKLVDWAGALASLFGIALLLVRHGDFLLIIIRTCILMLSYRLDSDITRRLDPVLGLAGNDRHAHCWRSAARCLLSHRVSICEAAPFARPTVSLRPLQ